MDEESKTTGWAEAIDKEVTLLRDEFKCFEILPEGTDPPPGYQYIKLLWTFDIKYDGRKRARCVAGGHMTEKLDDNDKYSSVVSLDTIKMVFLCAKLMDLECLAADVTSAYIQAYTKEMVYTIAGP